MRILNIMQACGLAIALAGCASPSKVQKMIDTSHQEFLKKSTKNADSIRVLRKTAKVSLEKDSKQTATILKLKKQLAEATAALESLQTSLEATKVMSASSIVKMSELKNAVAGNKSVMELRLEKMCTTDELYAQALLAYFQGVADSAKMAVATLKNEKISSGSGSAKKPVPLVESIEIIAPDTSAPTNSGVGE